MEPHRAQPLILAPVVQETLLAKQGQQGWLYSHRSRGHLVTSLRGLSSTWSFLLKYWEVQIPPYKPRAIRNVFIYRAHITDTAPVVTSIPKESTGLRAIFKPRKTTIFTLAFPVNRHIRFCKTPPSLVSPSFSIKSITVNWFSRKFRLQDGQSLLHCACPTGTLYIIKIRLCS